MHQRQPGLPSPLRGGGGGGGPPQGQCSCLPPPPDLSPQGGREQEGALRIASIGNHRCKITCLTHFASSFSPSLMSCAVSAFSPAMREAPAMAAAACGGP